MAARGFTCNCMGEVATLVFKRLLKSEARNGRCNAPVMQEIDGAQVASLHACYA